MVVQASIDEKGNAHGGKAGDQTGREVNVSSWYDHSWDVVLRHKNTKIAAEAADIAIKLAKSNLVGYDQYQRNTLYAELKKNDFDVDKYIRSGVKTETDCSAFVYACYACLIPAMRKDGNAPTTSTMRAFFKQFDFSVYANTAYRTGESKLKKGDVILREGSHVVMEVSSKAPTVKRTKKTYYVQCGAYKSRILADTQSIVVSKKGYPAKVVKGKILYFVRISVANMTKAKEISKKLTQEGVQNFVGNT